MPMRLGRPSPTPVLLLLTSLALGACGTGFDISGDPGTAIGGLGETWGDLSPHGYSKRQPWNADQSLTSNYRDDVWLPYRDEVLAVPLDPAHESLRLGHLHRVDAGYESESQAVPSPDGLRVLFATGCSTHLGLSPHPRPLRRPQATSQHAEVMQSLRQPGEIATSVGSLSVF